MEEAERLTKLLAAVVFQKKMEEEQGGVKYAISQDAMLLSDLRRMTSTGKINEAENLLFDRLILDPNSHNFSVAGIFYRELSRLTDAELNQANFSRQEIMEGLQAVERLADTCKAKGHIIDGV